MCIDHFRLEQRLLEAQSSGARVRELETANKEMQRHLDDRDDRVSLLYTSIHLILSKLTVKLVT